MRLYVDVRWPTVRQPPGPAWRWDPPQGCDRSQGAVEIRGRKSPYQKGKKGKIGDNV